MIGFLLHFTLHSRGTSQFKSPKGRRGSSAISCGYEFAKRQKHRKHCGYDEVSNRTASQCRISVFFLNVVERNFVPYVPPRQHLLHRTITTHCLMLRKNKSRNRWYDVKKKIQISEMKESDAKKKIGIKGIFVIKQLSSMMSTSWQAFS